jgi:type II secretory pathway component GspD/PulD (secretin)
MAFRRVLPLLVLLFGLLVSRAETQEPPPAKPSQKTQPADTAALERRVATLEAQVAGLKKEIEKLRSEPKAPAVAKVELKIFTLKHAKAGETTKVLLELLRERDGQSPRIVGDPGSNTVLVRGSREQLEMIDAVITRLDEASDKRGAK